MTPQSLLTHYDSGQPWAAGVGTGLDVAAAYQRALEVRTLQIGRAHV